MINLNLGFDISKDDVIDTSNDIVRALTQAIIVHFLFYSIDGEGELFSERMIKKLLYITISMIIFNFVTKKIFVPKK